MKEPMNDALWQQLTQDVMTGMRDWRAQHPKATLREMEQELDTRLNRMRARMLEVKWTPCQAHPDQQFSFVSFLV
jgi:hypothetical protein